MTGAVFVEARRAGSELAPAGAPIAHVGCAAGAAGAGWEAGVATAAGAGAAGGAVAAPPGDGLRRDLDRPEGVVDAELFACAWLDACAGSGGLDLLADAGDPDAGDVFAEAPLADDAFAVEGFAGDAGDAVAAAAKGATCAALDGGAAPGTSWPGATRRSVRAL